MSALLVTAQCWLLCSAWKSKAKRSPSSPAYLKNIAALKIRVINSYSNSGIGHLVLWQQLFQNVIISFLLFLQIFVLWISPGFIICSNPWNKIWFKEFLHHLTLWSKYIYNKTNKKFNLIYKIKHNAYNKTYNALWNACTSFS